MTQSVTPWNNDYGNPAIVRAKTDGERGTLVICECLDPEDAVFIVRACNAYDDLVAALRQAEELFWEIKGDFTDPRTECRSGAEMCAKAIAKAEGQS